MRYERQFVEPGLEQGPRRRLISDGVLSLALVTMATIIVWQNVIWPSWISMIRAKPVLVAPRGDLAADEQDTIQLFNSASPSVVHITTHALKRDFFTRDVFEIPQGNGTGFVWDKQGHIVTNFHVIESATQLTSPCLTRQPGLRNWSGSRPTWTSPF